MCHSLNPNLTLTNLYRYLTPANPNPNLYHYLTPANPNPNPNLYHYLTPANPNNGRPLGTSDRGRMSFNCEVLPLELFFRFDGFECTLLSANFLCIP